MAGSFAFLCNRFEVTVRPTVMARVLMAIAAAFLAVTVTSCGNDSGDEPAVRISGSPAASASPPPGRPNNPRASSYTVSPDGRTLTVEYGVGVCPPATYGADATETSKKVEVVIAARTWETQAPGTACIELARIEHASVTLDSPLGNRTVVDEGGPAVARG